MGFEKVNPKALETESAEIAQPEAADAGGVPESIAEQLRGIQGVEGVGSAGDNKVMVFVRDPASRGQIPSTIEGREVVVRISGPISAQRHRLG